MEALACWMLKAWGREEKRAQLTMVLKALPGTQELGTMG